MKFMTAGDLRDKSAEVWKTLSTERELVFVNHGHPVAVMASVGDGDVEDLLRAFRSARALGALAAIQQASVARGTDAIRSADIDNEIRAVRRARHK